MSKEDDKKIVFFSHTTLDKAELYHEPKDIKLNAVCPECGAVMKFKEGKYGEFLGCSRYPKCKHAEKIQIIGKII